MVGWLSSLFFVWSSWVRANWRSLGRSIELFFLSLIGRVIERLNWWLCIISVKSELSEDADVGEDLESSAKLKSQGRSMCDVVTQLIEVSSEPDQNKHDRKSRGILSAIVQEELWDSQNCLHTWRGIPEESLVCRVLVKQDSEHAYCSSHHRDKEEVVGVEAPLPELLLGLFFVFIQHSLLVFLSLLLLDSDIEI